ncbi:RtcB family protein, partial [Salmonella enterica subsp. enterica serovar Kentucky]|nr:RtcB family protein [Salmonella enterica subsp. enterica serovar Kentucky]
AQLKRQYGEETETVKRDKDEIEKPSIFALLPAYALSEIKSAFMEKPIALDMDEINCHHNYVQKEQHFGEEIYVTRKGAVSARRG